MGIFWHALVGFVGTYLLIALLGAALWPHLALGLQFAIAVPLALAGAGLRVRQVKGRVG